MFKNIGRAKRGQAGVVGALVGVATVAIFLYVISVLLDNLDDSFATELSTGSYAGVYNDTRDNSVTAVGLMTIVLILLAGGALLMAITNWVRAR